MKIFWLNNDGAGFANHIDVAEGMTVQQFFAERMGSAKPQDYLIRVNRQPVPADQVLREGDRVSCTPVKIEGGGLSLNPVLRHTATNAVDRFEKVPSASCLL